MSKRFKRIRRNIQKQKEKQKNLKNQAIQNFEKRSSENKQYCMRKTQRFRKSAG